LSPFNLIGLDILTPLLLKPDAMRLAGQLGRKGIIRLFDPVFNDAWDVMLRRELIGAVLLVGCLWVTPAHAEMTPFADKAAHFGLSYVMTDQLVRVGAPTDWAILGVIGIGLTKEFLDSRRGTFDFGDLTADIAGALCAGYLRLDLRL
jgi:hypothetical protein